MRIAENGLIAGFSCLCLRFSSNHRLVGAVQHFNLSRNLKAALLLFSASINWDSSSIWFQSYLRHRSFFGWLLLDLLRHGQSGPGLPFSAVAGWCRHETCLSAPFTISILYSPNQKGSVQGLDYAMRSAIECLDRIPALLAWKNIDRGSLGDSCLGGRPGRDCFKPPEAAAMGSRQLGKSFMGPRRVTRAL